MLSNDKKPTTWQFISPSNQTSSLFPLMTIRTGLLLNLTEHQRPRPAELEDNALQRKYVKRIVFVIEKKKIFLSY